LNAHLIEQEEELIGNASAPLVEQRKKLQATICAMGDQLIVAVSAWKRCVKHQLNMKKVRLMDIFMYKEKLLQKKNHATIVLESTGIVIVFIVVEKM
jgi:hypothetical protein